MTRPFQQRKGQRGMRTGDDRALDIAFQIGASKAIRNVICNSLQSFADFAYLDAAYRSKASGKPEAPRRPPALPAQSRA